MPSLVPAMGRVTVWTRLLSFVLSLAVLLLAVAPALATSITTDLWVYAQGDTVNVSGDGFGPSENVEIVTTDPYGVVVDDGVTTSDPSGYIAYSFVFNSDVPGIYDVVATGLSSGLTASTQFDPAVWGVTTNAPAAVQYSNTASFSGTLTCTKSTGGSDCPTTAAGMAGALIEVMINIDPDGAGGLPTSYYTVASTSTIAANCTINSTTTANGLKGTCTWSTSWQAGQLTVGATSYSVPAGNYSLRVRATGGPTGNPAGSNSSKDDSQSLTISKAGTTTVAAHSGDTSLGNTVSVDWIVSSPSGVTGNTAQGSVAVVQTGGPAAALHCLPATQPVSEAQATGVGPEPFGFYETSGPIGEAFMCTPTSAGTYLFYVQFTDTDGDYNGSQSGVLTLVISNANTPPTISDIADQSTNEDTSTGDIAFTVGDVETPAGSLTVSGSSSNTTLVPNGNISFGGSGASRTVSILPALNQFGTATITVTVSDGSLTGSDSFVLTVNAVNDAPIVTLSGDATADEGQTKTYSFSITDIDSTSFSVDAYDCGLHGVPSAFSFGVNSGSFKCTWPDNFNDEDVSVDVSDDDGGTDSDAISVDIANVNPVVTLVGANSTNEGAATAYTFSITDAGTADTFSVTAEDCGAHGALTLNSFSVNSGGFTCTWPDNFSAEDVSVDVSDDDGGTDSDAISVNVLNVAPSIVGFSAVGPSGAACQGVTNTVTVSFTASDPADNAHDPITGSIDWGDGSLPEPISGRSISKTHNYVAGIWLLHVNINDGDGGSASASGSGSIEYVLTAFLPPLNVDGSSVFKYGSTIPVKIQVLDCNNNPVPGLTPHIGWALLDSATPPAGVNETASTSAADTTGVMRFSDPQYIYNFSTKQSGITDFNANYYFYVWDPAHQFAYKTIKWGLRLK